MANEELLLRMLEPVVRPDGLSGRSRAPSQPFESQSFEDMLADARQADAVRTPDAQEPVQQSNAAAPAGLTLKLATFDQIENPTLRNLIAALSPPNPATLE